jgi:hypothetical protein
MDDPEGEEASADLVEWLADQPDVVAGRTLPSPGTEPWNPVKHREDTARWLAWGSGALFAAVVIDLLFRDSAGDLESKVLPVLAGFVGLAFGYYFRHPPPGNGV